MAISFHRASVSRQQADGELLDLSRFIEKGVGGTYTGCLFVYEGYNSSIVLLAAERGEDRVVVKIEGNIIYRLRYRTSHLYKALKEVAEERGYILKLCDEIDNDDISSMIFYNWNGKLSIDGGKLCSESRLRSPQIDDYGEIPQLVEWTNYSGGVAIFTAPF